MKCLLVKSPLAAPVLPPVIFIQHLQEAELPDQRKPSSLIGDGVLTSIDDFGSYPAVELLHQAEEPSENVGLIPRQADALLLGQFLHPIQQIDDLMPVQLESGLILRFLLFPLVASFR